ncbi:MAG TPA: flagellar basal body-associated FliL family protein [Bordetella sp.]
MATTIKSPTKLGSVSSSSGLGFGGLLRPLIWLLVLIIVAALCIAGTWFYLHWQSSRETNPVQLSVGQSSTPTQVSYTAPPAVTQIPAPIFMPLDPFTVMLEDKDSERLLHVALTLRLGDEQSRARIEKYLPEVRSRILMVLSDLSPQDIRTPEGKAGITKSVAAAVSKPFAPIPDGQNVSDVLFTEFVVQ